MKAELISTTHQSNNMEFTADTIIAQILTLTLKNAIFWEKTGSGWETGSTYYDAKLGNQSIDISRHLRLFGFGYQLRFVEKPSGTFVVSSSKRLVKPLFDAVELRVNEHENKNRYEYVDSVLKSLTRELERQES